MARFDRGTAGHVTRRTLLSGAAAAGAVSMLRANPGVAAAVSPGSVFTHTVGGLSGESAPLRPGRGFSLVGIQWSHPAEARIELRALGADGRWSAWVPASTLGHDGDGQLPVGSRFGEPVWTGFASAVQLRTDRHLSGLRVHFVSPRGAAVAGARAAAASPLATPVLDAGPGQPQIIARRAWAQGLARPRHLPEYGSVNLAFVHHTVNPNGYSAGEVPAMLRAIFDYHVHVRGWWDIGYNFVVDAFGRIWEARAGGIDMAVVGAQAGAYNTESTGVAMLGDFMNALPSQPALTALQNLLAWKLSLHGVPATGRVTVVVDPKSAYYTRFRPGAHVSLPRIAGHRDGDLTDCPGNALYHQLPSLRARVSSLAGTPARLTITSQPVLINAGATATLSGILSLLTGQRLAGAPVELQQLSPGGPPAVTFAAVSTAEDGSWSQVVSFSQNTVVRALHRPAPASVADWIEIFVAPVITLTLASTSPLLITGTASPSKRRVTVDLYRAGNPRKPIVKKRVTTSGGAFRAQLAVPGPGSYVVVARTNADRGNAAGASAPLAVTIA